MTERRPPACFIVLAISLLLICSLVNAQTKQKVFTASNDTICNPERGLYVLEETGMARGRITPYQKLNAPRLQQIRQRYSTVFRYFGLKEWRGIDLPDSILRFIGDDFAAIREADLKCIPRFTYSANIGEPDASLAITLRHISQLKPILRANSDIIAVMQAGFIGAWGEWHSSTNGHGAIENKRSILNAILDALPSERMVQVRTPHYKQEIFLLPFDATAAVTPQQAFDGSGVSRVGHHNDCFLADESDMGTYNRNGQLDTALAKAYLHLDTRFVPMGGETCQPSTFAQCANAVSEMKRLRWTFLNNEFDESVLRGFVTGSCTNEIQRKLGYRLSVLGAEFTGYVKPLGKVSFIAQFTNSGWASPFNRRDVELLLRNRRDSSTYVSKLPCDPRYWQSGDTVSVSISAGIPSTMLEGSYDVLVNFPDPSPSLHFRPGYSIRLANDNTWESRSGYNTLQDSIVVTNRVSGESYHGLLWFQPLSRNIAGGAAPTQFSLEPNYPNPFNTSTTISFQLARPSNVELAVFDMTGRRLIQLVNEVLPESPQSYHVRFNAVSLASGTYIAQLRAVPLDGSGRAAYVASRKLLLLK
jgi:hypothetical protein